MSTTSTMNIALPEPPRAYVARRVESGQFGNNSEYLRDLTLGISGSRIWPGCGLWSRQTKALQDLEPKPSIARPPWADGLASMN